MKQISRHLIIYILIFFLVGTSGCVSRYTPLKKINPLSGDCEDYAEFSVAILRQRDQGFTKRATISITGYSVGDEDVRKVLYHRYQPMFGILFADYLINDMTARAAGRTICRHQLAESWSLLINQDYHNAAEIVRDCQKANFSEVDIGKCLLTQIKGDDNLEAPPV